MANKDTKAKQEQIKQQENPITRRKEFGFLGFPIAFNPFFMVNRMTENLMR